LEYCRFAEALLSLLDDTPEKAGSLANEAISSFPETYRSHCISGMRAKLGLFNEEPGDEELAEALFACMKRNGADTPNTFRGLASETLPDTPVFRDPAFSQWYGKWKARLKRQAESREESRNRMRAHSPAVIPRNHRMEEALEAAVERENFQVMERLLDICYKPSRLRWLVIASVCVRNVRQFVVFIAS
jgi:serine/tyrosine/threonine adenylyltransferase